MKIEEKIVTLWGNGSPAEEIAEILKVPTFQVQAVIDSVIDNATIDWDTPTEDDS